MKRDLFRPHALLLLAATALTACSSAAVPDNTSENVAPPDAEDVVTTQDVTGDAVELAETTRPTISIGGRMAPVNLLAKVYPDGSTKPAMSTERTSFNVPKRLEVTVGNAGNGEARLTVATGKSTEYVCTYRGGASSNEPLDALDLARGKFYDFESCSNGLTAGSRTAGSAFSLELLSGASKIGRTSVHLDLGDGCQTSIGYPMDPVDSVLLRDGFDWKDAQALPELNAAGYPNLYYVNIYVEGPAQREALDDLRVSYRNKPFFEHELERFKGKCGAVNHNGDGEGAFVYAVIPAQIYNVIREIEQKQSTHEGYPGFRAITMRDVPANYRGEDGALSYEALARAGFKYDPTYDPNAEPRVYVRSILGDMWRWVADAADELVDLIQRGIAEMDRWISGSYQVRIETHVYNKDDAFGGTNGADVLLRRVWGPNTGREMYLEGVRVDVGLTRYGFIPEVVYGNVGTTGIATVQVPEGTDSSSICLHLRIGGIVRFEDGLASVYEVCNFGNGLNDGPEPSVHFNSNKDLLWEVTNWEAGLMAQFIDAHRYGRDVIGVTPDETGRVLLKGYANWTENVYTPCSNMSDFDISQILPILDIFTDVDMILPSDMERVRRKRTVIPHEWGHYLMCMMIDNSSTFGVEKLIQARVADGDGVIESGDFVAVFMESFADFISQQLSGGVEYFDPEDPSGTFTETQVDDWDSEFCHLPVKPANPPLYFGPHCLDRNFDGTETTLEPHGRGEAYQMIGMYASLWHDMFDGHPGAYSDNVPVNANIYVLDDNDFLRIAQWPFGPNGRPLEYIDDDPIALSGPNMFDWIKVWQNPTTGYSGRFSRDDVLGALDWVMVSEDYNWCERCVAVAMHDSSAPPTWESDDMFSYCPDQEWLHGEPPIADHRRLSTGCVVCPEGHSPGWNNECVPNIVPGDPTAPPCEENEVYNSTNDSCYDCPPGWVLDTFQFRNGPEILICAEECHGSWRPDFHGFCAPPPR